MVGVILLVLISIPIYSRQQLILEEHRLLYKVKNKLTGEIFFVFSAKNEESGRTEFLIYNNNQWQWVLSDTYIPC
jgi:hypothetical protein